MRIPTNLPFNSRAQRFSFFDPHAFILSLHLVALVKVSPFCRSLAGAGAGGVGGVQPARGWSGDLGAVEAVRL